MECQCNQAPCQEPEHHLLRQLPQRLPPLEQFPIEDTYREWKTSVYAQAGIQCQDCHGSMSDVGDPGRQGWLQEPNCQACHTGTAAAAVANPLMTTRAVRF